MASGKASKRKRAQQAQVAAPRQGVDRRLVVAASVAAVLVAAVVVGVLTTRGAEPETAARGATLPNATESTALYEGIPQRGLTLGRDDAPVTLVEYVDMQCPYCREFEVDALPALVDRHVRTGKLRVELRGLAFIGPDSDRGMRAVLAASRQNRLFEVKGLLFANQGHENTGWLTDELAEAAARSVPGTDVARFTSDMGSGAVSALLQEHAREASRLGVDSTPTIFVGATGGDLRRVELASPSDLGALERAIAAAAA